MHEHWSKHWSAPITVNGRTSLPRKLTLVKPILVSDNPNYTEQACIAPYDVLNRLMGIQSIANVLCDTVLSTSIEDTLLLLEDKVALAKRITGDKDVYDPTLIALINQLCDDTIDDEGHRISSVCKLSFRSLLGSEIQYVVPQFLPNGDLCFTVCVVSPETYSAKEVCV